VRERDERIVSLSRTPPEPDPEALRDRADLTVGRIDLAVARGDLPPAIADKLKRAVVADGKPNAFLLSRSDAIGARPVEYVLSLFDGAKLNPPLGSQVVFPASRTVPGADVATDDDKAAADDGEAQGKAWKDAQLKARGLPAA
jgi:hypothetical protein